jgi:hypothetical protein
MFNGTVAVRKSGEKFEKLPVPPARRRPIHGPRFPPVQFHGGSGNLSLGAGCKNE